MTDFVKMERQGKPADVHPDMVNSYCKAGYQIAEGSGSVQSGLTPDDIAKMGKDELRDMLKLHGITPAGRAGVKSMRKQLSQTIFVGL